MTNTQIIELIYKDNRYKSICKGLAKRPERAEELHSMFVLELLEIKDERLITAHKEGYLEVFCVGIINNLWGTRNRVKSYVIGSTSPLFEYTSTIETADNYFSEPDKRYNYKIDSFSKEAQRIIERELNSECVNTMYKARVFYYSYNKMLPDIKASQEKKTDGLKLKVDIENPKQYSELSNIPYITVIKTCNQVKERLRKIFKNKIYD